MKACRDSAFPSWRAIAAVLAAGVVAAACATTEVRSQWADAAFANHSLKGARVLVVCDAVEVSVRRNCQEQIAAQVRQLGGVAVLGADSLHVGPAGATDPALVSAAHSENAAAVLGVQLSPDATAVSSSPSFSFGFGGFGGSGNTAGGVGVAMPVGDTQVNTGYAANASLADGPSGRLMWAAKIATPASSNLNTQVQELAKKLGEELLKAAVF
jgi:hypothetical protein